MKLIKDIRRDNLRRLLRRAATQAEFAEKVGSSPVYLSQLLSNRTVAEMGDEFARKVEAAYRLETGWMDNVHDPLEPGSFRRVWVLRIAQATQWRDVLASPPEGTPQSTFAVDGAAGRRIHGYRVEGSGMSSFVPTGAIAIVNPDLEPRARDYVVAVLTSGATMFRQLDEDGGTRFLKATDRRFPFIPLEEVTAMLVITQFVIPVRDDDLDPAELAAT